MQLGGPGFDTLKSSRKIWSNRRTHTELAASEVCSRVAPEAFSAEWSQDWNKAALAALGPQHKRERNNIVGKYHTIRGTRASKTREGRDRDA